MIGKLTVSLLTLLVFVIVLKSVVVESGRFSNQNVINLRQFKKLQRIIRQRKLKHPKTTTTTTTTPTTTTTTTTPTTTTTTAATAKK